MMIVSDEQSVSELFGIEVELFDALIELLVCPTFRPTESQESLVTI